MDGLTLDLFHLDTSRYLLRGHDMGEAFCDIAVESVNACCGEGHDTDMGFMLPQLSCCRVMI